MATRQAGIEPPAGWMTCYNTSTIPFKFAMPDPHDGNTRSVSTWSIKENEHV
jgi:hypothetical protein